MSVDGMASRRSVLLGAGAVCALGLLAACGVESPSNDSGGAGGTVPTDGIAIADVPVGGGILVGGVVVTQPAEGEFHAFSRACPHEGNPVQSIRDRQIICPFHGSTFKIEDGSVITGPATRGLTVRTVTVQGDRLLIG